LFKASWLTGRAADQRPEVVIRCPFSAIAENGQNSETWGATGLTLGGDVLRASNQMAYSELGTKSVSMIY